MQLQEIPFTQFLPMGLNIKVGEMVINEEKADFGDGV